MEQRHPSSGIAAESPAPGLLHCSAKDHQGGRWLPPDAFWRRTASPDGKQAHCKACSKRAGLERYYRNPRAMRERNKRYRLRTNYVHPPQTQERNRERKRRERLETRLKRARLVLDLVAQEYALPVTALHGMSRCGTGSKEHEAQAVTARLIRQLTVFSAEEIAQIMDCTPRAVARRIARART